MAIMRDTTHLSVARCTQLNPQGNRFDGYPDMFLQVMPTTNCYGGSTTDTRTQLFKDYNGIGLFYMVIYNASCFCHTIQGE